MVRVIAAICVFICVGCSAAPQIVPTQQRGSSLPAYSSVVPSGTFLCPGGRFIPSVVGRLTGDPADSRLVWLMAPSGVRLEIDWPPGFSVVFEPTLRLIDDEGASVAAGGGSIDINTNPTDHAGTAEDPYPANQFNERCYAPPVNPVARSPFARLTR